MMGQADQSQRLVPNLRFPEFRGARAWTPRVLSELLSEPKKRNRDLNYGPEHVLSVSGEYGCVNQIEFMGRSYAGVSVKDYHVVDTGDVVYTKSPLKMAPYGIIKANRGPCGIVSTLYAVYRPTADASAGYLDHYFSSSHNLNSYLQPLVKKGPKNDMKVKNSDVLTGTVYAPDLIEQRKVADCLSSLDAVIAEEGKRLEALRAHKKGLMQALFPTEGQTTAPLRFPEFRSAKEWTSAELGTVAEVKLGKMLDQKKAGSGQSYPYLNNIAVRWNSINTSNLPEMDFLPHELHRFGLIAGDVLVCEGGEPGRAAVWDGARPEVRFQKAIHRVRFHVPYEPELFVTYLEAIAGTNSFKGILTGEGIKHLTRENFLKLKIPIIGCAERKKINSTFVSLNEVIRDTTARIYALKTYKSGLMQQLFLPPAETA